MVLNPTPCSEHLGIICVCYTISEQIIANMIDCWCMVAYEFKLYINSYYILTPKEVQYSSSCFSFIIQVT